MADRTPPPASPPATPGTSASPSAPPQVPSGWNQKNPAVRRILADVRELARDPSDQYAAKPVEENMFEWHFVIRGPKGTDFEGGRYHGKILLPAEYPFKPPHIVFLTPNGRWETKTKICLSMSAYHPEDWQPAWGIRTMLEALISFMPSPSDGALGALDCTPEQRKRLATESINYTHPLMPPLPELGSGTFTKSDEYAQAVAQMKFQANNTSEKEQQGAATPSSPGQASSPAAPTEQPQLEEEKTFENAVAGDTSSSSPAVRPVNGQQPEENLQPAQQATPVPVVSATTVAATVTTSSDLPSDRLDEILKFTSWALLVAIFILTYRKLLLTYAPEL